MKKTFKRFLSSALAAVMAASVLSVGMVTSASAATVFTELDGSGRTFDFGSNNTEYTYQNDDAVGKDIGAGIICEKGKVVVKEKEVDNNNSSVIKVPVPENSSGSITIYGTSGQSSRTVAIEGSTEIKMQTAGDSADFANSVTDDGFVSVTSKSDFKFNKIVIKLNPNSTKYPIPTTYTLTGNSTSLPAKSTFTLTSGSDVYTVTVDEGGTTFSLSQQTEIKAGTYAVKAKGYSSNPSEVTIETSGDNTFTVKETITFTKLVLTAIPESKTFTGVDVDEGLPNFEINKARNDVSGTAVKYAKDVTIKFILANTATVTLSAMSDNNSDEFKVLLDDREKTGANKKTWTNGHDIVFENVTAGEHTLKYDSNNPSSWVYSIKIEYTDKTMADNKAACGSDYAVSSAPSTFIIHPVTNDELEYGTLALDGHETEVSTDKVYAAVALPDGSTINAKDIIGAVALYAFEAEFTDGKTTPAAPFVWKDAGAQ